MACCALAPVPDEDAAHHAYVYAEAVGLRMANAGQLTSVMRSLG